MQRLSQYISSDKYSDRLLMKPLLTIGIKMTKEEIIEDVAMLFEIHEQIQNKTAIEDDVVAQALLEAILLEEGVLNENGFIESHPLYDTIIGMAKSLNETIREKLKSSPEYMAG